MKLNWKGIGAGLVTVLGVLSDPHILNMLGPKASAVIAGIGIILQGVTNPVHQTDSAS